MKLAPSPLLSFFFAIAVVWPGNVRVAAQSSTTSQPSQKGSIAVVADSFGTSFPGIPATIRTHSLTLDIDQSATVENLSNVTFNNLPPDKYRILVTAPGHEPAQMEVSLSPGEDLKVSVAVNPNSLQHLTLRRDASEEAPLSTIDSISTPTNIAEASPVPTSIASCRVEELLPRVTSNVKEFLENVNRFTATEVLEREHLGRDGKLKEQSHSKSNYVATIERASDGVYVVDEFRNQTRGDTGTSANIAATGVQALALIFHSSHVKEFSMTCQGLSVWQGRRVWQVYFQQRLDQPATMSRFRAGNDVFAILLKGSAWIDCDNYQILHMETDLLKPIPEMRLDMEHQSVDYRSVSFTERDTRLWLPQVAEITVDFRGKRLVERHIYNDYRLFYVDTGQKISKPPNSPNSEN